MGSFRKFIHYAHSRKPLLLVLLQFWRQGAAFFKSTFKNIHNSFCPGAQTGNIMQQMGSDGRLAGKPFLFHNPSRANYTMNLAEEKLGVHAYEINFQPFTDWGDMPISQNRVPALTGNTSSSGINSGSFDVAPINGSLVLP